MSDAAMATRIGALVDANVHLWDQAATLRYSFADVCRAYDEIFRSRNARERGQLFHDTAMRWLGAPPPR
jgi:predicted TIM-barrel fold metal-dependent hydrolase